MSLVRVAAPPALRPHIEAIWDWRVAPSSLRFERILPQPGSSLIINLGEDETRVYDDDAGTRCERAAGAVYSGQFIRSFVIDTEEQVAVMGVSFRPGGARGLLREPMDAFADRHIALDDLVPAGRRGLRERLQHARDAPERIAVLSAWLVRTWGSGAAVHPAVSFGLAALASAPNLQRIATIAADSGLSTRRFGALFREQIGVGPKAYARMLRFRALLAHVGHARVDWCRVAQDCGFHDQSHLNHEFRAFSGMTPNAYLARRGTAVNHVLLP